MERQPLKQYAYPPIYNFPPFFTLQRNPSTYTSQLKLWTKLVLDYCQYHRVFSLNIDALALDRTGAADELFKNGRIKRELSADGKREVLKALVEEGERRKS
jgi:ESCRT-II complex subunit VPS25